MISNDPLRGRVFLLAFSVSLFFLILSSTGFTNPVKADAISILCIAEIVEAAEGVMDDPCDDSELNMNQVTAIRSTADLPADLSPFDVITFSSSSNVIYNSVASEINEYIANGGSLMLAFPVVESGTNPLPTGFEFTMTSILWPEFPADPGPVEFTAAGLAHPIADGVTADNLIGAINTIPISSLGSKWDLLVKPINHPNVGIAVGEHGTGRILMLNIGIDEETPSGLKFATQILDWLAGESSQPPPSGPDMQIDAIEVTQAIQDLNNSVDLIAGKRTYVRVHASAAETVDGVTAELKATRGANALPQTLMPINDGGRISVIPDPDRGQINDSFLFELPIGWADDGSLRLTAEIDPNNEKLDPDRLNNTAGVVAEFITAEPLRLRLINVRFDDRGNIYVADEVHLDLIESWLKKAYPISTIEVRRSIINYPYDTYPNVNRSIEGLIVLKHFESLFLDTHPDTYYYAAVEDPRFLLQGSAASDHGVAIGPVGDPQTAANQAWDTDASYGDWIAGHEVGHLVGREHVDCPDINAPNIAPYPYEDGKISPTATGDDAIYGFDLDTQAIYGPEWVDVMSYCFPKWISDFTYEGIYDDMSAGGRSADLAEVTADRFMIVSGFANLETSTVESINIQQIDQTATVPLPSPGDWNIVLLNAAGEELASYPFAPSGIVNETSHDVEAIVSEIVPWQAGVTTVEVRNGSAVLATKTASNSAPAITITAPAQGATFGDGELNFAWTGTDADNDPLTYTVLYSHLGEGSWEVLTTDLVTPSISVDSALLAGGTNSYLRIIGSDGFNSGEATVGPFTVPAAAPRAVISVPATDNETYSAGQLVSLAGNAYDLENGAITGIALSWSSNIDGDIGTGELLQTDTLSAGVHTITLTAADGDDETGQAQRTVTILDGTQAAPNSLTVAPFSINIVVSVDETLPVSNQLTIRNKSGAALDWTASTNAAWLSVDQSVGTTPSSINLTVDSSGLAAGDYTGAVIFESAGAGNSPLEVPVSLRVSETALPSFTWNVFLPTVTK